MVSTRRLATLIATTAIIVGALLVLMRRTWAARPVR